MVFVGSSMFQAMGHTLPALISSFVRIAVVVLPAIYLSRLPGFELRWIWYLSVSGVLLQVTLQMLLLRREFRVRLGALTATAPAA